MGDSAGFWQPILTLAVGIGGVAIGSALTASFQHRQWLRDARRSTYGQLILALDRAADAGDAYVRSLRSYAMTLLEEKHGEDGADEALSRLVAMKMAADDWQQWRDAEGALDRERTAFELIVTRQTQATALLATLGSTSILGWYWKLKDPASAAEAIEACDLWDAQSQQRTTARTRLVERARLDLGRRSTLHA